jgi:Sec-independent protein translocase protein TatA
MAEAAVIAIVALVLLGPDKLPAVMRGAAKAYRRLSRLRSELSKAFEEGLGPELKELKGLKELKPGLGDLAGLKADLEKPLKEVAKDIPKAADLSPAPSGAPAAALPPPPAGSPPGRETTEPSQKSAPEALL